MAAVTAATRAMGMSSSEAGHGHEWDYAVPANQENMSDYDYDQAGSNEVSYKANSHVQSRQPASNYVSNGYTSSRRSSQSHNHHDYQQRSTRSRKASVQDNYGEDVTGKESPNLGQERKNSTSQDDSAMRYNPYYVEDDPDSEKWIHRDKLAEIEDEELKQFGIIPPRRVRAGSKTSRKAGRSRDRSRDDKRQRVASPGRIDDQKQVEQNAWDPRLPEEIAMDPYEAGGTPRSLGLKKSGSRIPVLSSSPLTASPATFGDNRPRTRGNTSGNGDDDSLNYVKNRARSQSAGSQVLLDDLEDPNGTRTPATSRPNSGYLASSPVKKPGPRKTSATNGTRKPSAAATKPRTTSTARPTTRSGETRPTTAVNRPEGDPPWLATMYKPDPRLPPEQQMLPTHAKRLAQEQWEKEGKVPNAYDRDFTPVSVHPDRPPPVLTSPTLQPPDAEGHQQPGSPSGTWPLSNQALKSPTPSEGRPSTSGGYSTMPTVQPSPPIGIPTSPRPPQHRFSMQDGPRPHGMTATVEAQNPPEKKKGGCGGCCIVM